MGGNVRVWNSCIFGEFNDWELAASFSFLHLIQSRIPRGVGSDSLCWGLNGSGKFDTRSFYHKIQVASTSFFPWNGIWKVKIPKRVVFFKWTAVHGQILILNNLILQGRPLANWCCMCCCNEESVDHLLIFLSISSFFVGAYTSIVWDPLGHARFCY